MKRRFYIMLICGTFVAVLFTASTLSAVKRPISQFPPMEHFSCRLADELSSRLDRRLDISEDMARMRREMDSLIRVDEFQNRKLTIACVGDMVLGINYPDNEPLFAPNDGAHLFDDVKSYLVDADFTVGNLEGVLLNRGGEAKIVSDPKYAYFFRMPERYAKHFVNAGFDFLSLANNHARDFGKTGMAKTMRTLKKAGIAYAGFKDICETAIVERDGVRYGMCAFAPHTLMCDLHDLKLAERLIRSLREEQKCHIIIVSFHGGAEGVKAYMVPRANETFLGMSRGDVYKFAHHCIDAGADLVYGHGPHVVRAMELYKGKLIAYSLGNFCTPYRVNRTGRTGYAPVLRVEMTTSGKFLGGEVISATQPARTGPKLDEHKVVIKEMRNLCRANFPESPLRIDEDGKLSVAQEK